MIQRRARAGRDFPSVATTLPRAGHVLGMKLITSLWPVAFPMRCNVRTDGKLPPFSRRPILGCAVLVREASSF